jgi:energy-converting hydrogenase Eha subunit C
MKKLGFAEILTILLVIIGAIAYFLHPEQIDKILGFGGSAIFLIAIFIGYGNND